MERVGNVKIRLQKVIDHQFKTKKGG